MLLPIWPRVHGAPLWDADIRTNSSDFFVAEELGFEPSDDGEHDLLHVEKTGCNTDWVARQLAAHASVPQRDVGYCGLKDRHAVTRQWFSVPRWHSPDWQAFEADGVEILDTRRNARKLRRGSHRGNRFRIVLRGQSPFREKGSDPVGGRLGRIASMGVPNYFGEQRFGRDGANLALAERWAGGARLSRHRRSLAISAARSIMFNRMLAERVVKGTWNEIKAGDVANLDGTGSVFDVDVPDAELKARVDAQDVHPAGPLWGLGSQRGDVPEGLEALSSALLKARVKQGWRSLRARIANLSAEPGDEKLILSFSLCRGVFATAVLRELVSTRDVAGAMSPETGRREAV